MILVSGLKSFGPFGAVLEVNPLGDKKVCNFDCVYCDKGPTSQRLSRLKTEITFPPVQDIADALGTALGELLRKQVPVDAILLSGNGEPTLHPEFGALVEALIKKKNSLKPSVKIVGMTNGDRLEEREITDAMNRLDERIVKLDAGNERLFKLVNRPLSRSKLERIIQGSRLLKDFIVQAAVFNSEGGLNSSTIEDWLEIVGIMKPKSVYLHAVTGPTADPKVVSADEDEIQKVAHLLDRRLKIKALSSSANAA